MLLHKKSSGDDIEAETCMLNKNELVNKE